MNTPYFLTSVPPSPKWQWSPGSTQSPCLCGVFALILSALPANLFKTASQSLAWWQQDCQQDVMSAFVMGWSKYKLWLVLLYIIEIVDKNDMTFSKIHADFLCRYIEFLDMSCDELSFPVHAVVVYVAICAALTTSRHRDTSPITSHISCACTIVIELITMKDWYCLRTGETLASSCLFASRQPWHISQKKQLFRFNRNFERKDWFKQIMNKWSYTVDYLTNHNIVN